MKKRSIFSFVFALSAAAFTVHAESVEELFERVDSNQDGQLSKAELIADAKRIFKLIDANGDGIISYEEFYADNVKSFNEIGQIMPADVVATITIQGIQRWDLNNDGQLTEDEYVNGMVNDTFEFADTNGDNLISLEEMRAFQGE